MYTLTDKIKREYKTNIGKVGTDNEISFLSSPYTMHDSNWNLSIYLSKKNDHIFQNSSQTNPCYFSNM